MIHFAAKIERNDPCWCGSGKKYKSCHMRFDEKIRSYQLSGHIVPDRSIIKTPEQIQGIKESAKVNMACLDAVAAACHGIPDEVHILKEGDIINVDCSTIYRGYFSDSSRMYCIGEVSEEKKRLVQVTKECVEIGLENVIPWTTLGDMGSKVHEHAVKNGYTVVKEIGGHGIGLEFHEDPFVSYVSKPGEEMLMVPGMVFTIEPMVNMGTDDIYQDDKNGWTIYTRDGKPSAQWEIQVLVTETGHEVLCW